MSENGYGETCAFHLYVTRVIFMSVALEWNMRNDFILMQWSYFQTTYVKCVYFHCLQLYNEEIVDLFDEQVCVCVLG